MAKLPDATALTDPSIGLSGRPIATVDETGYAKGAAAIGAGVADLGKGIEAGGQDIARVYHYQLAKNLEDAKNGAQTEIINHLSDIKNDTDFTTLPDRSRATTQDILNRYSSNVPEAQQPHFQAELGPLIARANATVEQHAFQLKAQDYSATVDTNTERRINQIVGTDDPVIRTTLIDNTGYDLKKGVADGFMTAAQANARFHKFRKDMFAADTQAAYNSGDPVKIQSTLDALRSTGDGSGDADLIKQQPIAASISKVADNLGIDPRVLTASISYETGGTFDPNKRGGKGNNYLGLIQFGPEERAKYGVHTGQTFDEQMGAVENFLRDRGVKPGMGVPEVYSIINAGSLAPNGEPRWNASDGNGTVAEHVARIEQQHMPVADRILSSGSDIPSAGGKHPYQLIDPVQREQLIRRGEIALNATDVDAQRQVRLAQQQAKQASDDAEGETFAKIVKADPNVTAASIVDDKRILPARQEHLVELLKNANKDKDSNSFGPGFYDLFNRVHADNGNPQKITDPQDLYAHVGKDGDLTMAGLDKLRGEIAGKKTPEGEAEAGMKKQLFKYAESQLSARNDLLHIKDPKGEEVLLKWMGQFYSDYDKGKSSGKTASQMLTPDSPDYIGKTVSSLKRSPAQINADLLSANGMGPNASTAVDTSTAQGLISAVQSGKVSRSEGRALALKNGWIREDDATPAPVPVQSSPVIPLSR